MTVERTTVPAAAEGLHERILEAVGQAVIVTSPDGTVQFWNAAAERMYGWTRAEATGRPIYELTVASGAQDDAEAIMTALRAGNSWSGEFMVTTRDGPTFPALVTNAPVTDAKGNLVAVVGVSTDLTEQVRREDRLRALADAVPEVVLVLDDDLRIVYANAAAMRLVGAAADLLLWRLPEVVEPDDADAVEAALALSSLPQGSTTRLQFRVRSQDGAMHQLEAFARNLSGVHGVEGISLTATDVTEPVGVAASAAAPMHVMSGRSLIEFVAPDDEVVVRAAVAGEGADESSHSVLLRDAVTGLKTRGVFDDRLSHLAARAVGGLVLVLAIDDFSTVVDSLGAAAADEVVQEIARRLTTATRVSDTVARVGRDQFAVLIEGAATPSAALDASTRVQRDVEAEPVAVDGQPIHISVSVGVSSVTPGEAAHVALRQAQTAVDRGRSRGRGRVELYDEQFARDAIESLRLAADLRAAVANGDLTFVYQPIVERGTRRVVGAETLMRWHHAERGPISPSTFIPVAEETGLIIELGELALRAGCTQAAVWASHGTPMGISVNLSARQLAHPAIVQVVEGALADTGLPATALTLEVTESAVMDDAETALEILSRLKDLGVRLSVDDFGTGYSSLAYLKRFPVDELKIDRSFVDALERDPDAAAIVAGVVGLAKAVGVHTVAEGVETPAQNAVLDTLGCDLLQGYLFSRPLPGSQLPHAIGQIEATAETLWHEAQALQSEQVRLVIQTMAAADASASTIAAALNARGLRARAGKRWSSVTVARELRSLREREDAA